MDRMAVGRRRSTSWRSRAHRRGLAVVQPPDAAEEGAHPRPVTLEHGRRRAGAVAALGHQVLRRHRRARLPRRRPPGVRPRRARPQVAFFPGYPLAVRAGRHGDRRSGRRSSWSPSRPGGAVTSCARRWFASKRRRPMPRGWPASPSSLFPWAFFLVATGLHRSPVPPPRRRRVRVRGAGSAVGRRGRRRRWPPITRLVGVGVVVGVASGSAERRGALTFDGWRPRLDRSRLRRRDAAVVRRSGRARLAWMAFCWIRYGDPIAFSDGPARLEPGRRGAVGAQAGLLRPARGQPGPVLRHAPGAAGCGDHRLRLAMPGGVRGASGSGTALYTAVALGAPAARAAPTSPATAGSPSMAFPVFGLARRAAGT